MRRYIIAFVLGVACLQQQAALWRVEILSFLFLFSLLFLFVVKKYWPLKATPLLRQSFIVGLFFLLGYVWASFFATWYLRDELASDLEGIDITVVGTVDSLPHLFPEGVRFNFLIERTLPDKNFLVRLPSKIALSWYTASQNSDASAIAYVKPGERWQLTVRMKRPYGNANPMGFDYEVWLLEQGLRATGTVRPDSIFKNNRVDSFVWSVGNIIDRSRSVLRERIHTALPAHPYAGVIVALVVGDQREVAQSDWKIFNRTGIGHLVSISGLHITMIAGLFASFMFTLWRHSFFTDAQLPLRLPAQKIAAVSGAMMALLYVALAGFGVPAQRTLYMLMVVAVAIWTGRLSSISHILCLALGVVVLFDPWAVLWPGFWLSFGAVAILLFNTIGRVMEVTPLTKRDNLRRNLWSAVRTQYGVTVGLVPLTLLLFGQISLISPVANALAIPLISFIVTPLSLLGSVMPAPLSTFSLQFAHVCVVGLVKFLQILSQQSFAVWSAPIAPLWMFFVAMLGSLWLLAPRGWPAPYLGLFCWIPLFANQATTSAQNEMTVTAFDVGQGMALLIETAKHRMLYDTGPYYSPESDGGSRVLLPYLNARGIYHLDAIVVSHNDNDHSGGALSLLAAIPTDLVMTSLKPDSPTVLASRRHQACVAGQRWEWDGVRFEILQPTLGSYEIDKLKPNSRSCTLKVSAGNLSILLPGDIEASQEAELVNNVHDKLSATVLLAPHHGSGTSSTPAFIGAVQPELAVFQVGYRNRYHHPKPEVYQRYADFGVNRLRTDEAGAITLQFGSTLTISEYRTEHKRYWYRR
jgi:competence protein ComEC